MKMKLKITVLLFMLYASGCDSVDNTPAGNKDAIKDSTVGVIELYDKDASSLIDTNATIEIIGRGYNWSEGPVWIAEKKLLLFSDVPENKIFQWKEGDTAKLYLTPSGYTDTAERKGENGSNGLTLDVDGKLLLCQSGNRQVVRLNSSFDAPKPDYTVLSANYNGKKFNSPNDLVADKKNNIYFTDPIYGLPEHENDPTREMNFEGVFKISTDGKTTLLIDSIPRPNGIALSLDEKILYVGSSDETRPRWYAYQLDDNGNIKTGGILLDAVPLRDKASVKQGPDGFRVDKNGNLFTSGPDGINIISPEGKRLGLIKIFDRPTSNCAFNETKDVLFVTADDAVLRVKLHPKN
jgi:gluconolactonase